jgi:hypothetical protein
MVASLQIQGITATLQSLVELLELEEDDDYGILRPTDHAFKTAMNLVLEAHTSLQDAFPRASATTDHLGGVRLTWKNPQFGKTVRLTSPANPTQTVDLYHSSADVYAVEDLTSTTSLAHWLEWILEA